MPAELLSGPLADALRRGRASFNARFAAASRVDSPIDAAEFQHHLAVILDPIVRTVAREFAERTDAVVDALFDLSLELFRHSLLGPRAKYPVIPEAWSDLLPRLPRLVARDPAHVAGAVTNALYNLARTPGARPQTWIKLCGASDYGASVNEFLDCGAILAWRCGMPQYRESALQKARMLSANLAAKALGIQPDQVPQAIANLYANPWIAPQGQPQGELTLVAQAGAFRGFAGPFLTPPRVASIAGELIASDRETSWRLRADLYNAVLLRCEAPTAAPSIADASIQSDGTLRWRGQERRFPELANATSIAATADTAAITLATSHHLFLVACV
ncbi:MAG TPA: hypothetical protein VGL72_19695 [Bryobacteraceae bacterium]|jgi:hypothetical protein